MSFSKLETKKDKSCLRKSYTLSEKLDCLNTNLQNILSESKNLDPNFEIYESDESENEDNLEFEKCSDLSDLESDLEDLNINE